MMLEIAKIDYDPKYYPRVNGAPDWITIIRYTEPLQLNPRFQMPKVVVVRATGYKFPYVLIDGLHRLRSYVRAGRDRIPATEERIPQSKWLARSVELNAQHGRPLDTGDKAWIATRLQEEGWEVSKVADLLHMKVESLEKMMVTRCVRISSKAAEVIKIGRSNRKVNGKHYGFLKAPLVESNGTSKAEVALKTQHSVTSHDVLAVLDSMVSVLESGVVDMKDEEVAARIEAIRKLLKRV